MSYRVTLSWPAKAAIESLPPLERSQVLRVFDRIKEGRLNDVPQAVRFRDSHRGDPYAIRANDALRVLFTLDGDVATVIDIVNRNVVRSFG